MFKLFIYVLIKKLNFLKSTSKNYYIFILKLTEYYVYYKQKQQQKLNKILALAVILFNIIKFIFFSFNLKVNIFHFLLFPFKFYNIR